MVIRLDTLDNEKFGAPGPLESDPELETENGKSHVQLGSVSWLEQVLNLLEQWFEAFRFFDDGGQACAIRLGVADAVFVDSKKDYLRRMLRFFQGSAGVQTVHAGHGQVHHNQIRIQGFGSLNGVDAIDRFVNDEWSLHLESSSDNQPYRLVVIDY